MNKPAVRVIVTGAAGRVAYALLFRIASGEMLGPDQPVSLVLFDLPRSRKALQGVVLELQDCALPLLADIVATDDPVVAFKDAQIALLVGARPRVAGMDRREVLGDNARIFAAHGALIGEHASTGCKVLVVGNPCNTNACVALQAARRFGRVSERNFAALMRLDHNRALARLAAKTGRPVAELAHLAIWGNHSPLVYADDRFATANEASVPALIGDAVWDRETLVAQVDGRGAAILAQRGAWAEASAAHAVIGQMRDWCFGTQGQWTTMGVVSDGAYGVPGGLVFGFPVTTEACDWRIVRGLAIDDFARRMIDANVRELQAELDMVRSLLPKLFD